MFLPFKNFRTSAAPGLYAMVLYASNTRVREFLQMSSGTAFSMQKIFIKYSAQVTYNGVSFGV